MKFSKIAIIWLAGMLTIIFISNTAGAIIIKNVAAEEMQQNKVGFARFVDSWTNPVKTSEGTEEDGTGLQGFIMRAILSDTYLQTKTKLYNNLSFSNVTIDESYIFFGKSGLNELSSGIFAIVYQNHGNNLDYAKYALGVIDVRDFIKSKNSSKIYRILDKNPQALIKLNSYTISNYIIKPVSMTILTPNETELLNVEFPYEGEIIQTPECYVYNKCTDKYNDAESLYHKMDTAKQGERNTDRIARELVNEVKFDKDKFHMYNKINYGFGTITAKHIEVRDGYAEIAVQQHHYMKGVVFYTFILGSIMTAIMFAVFRKRSRNFFE